MEHFLSYLKDQNKKFKIEDKEDLQGWMAKEILDVFDKLPKKKDLLMIEVGTWKGRSAISFGKHLEQFNGQLLCIDTWLGAPEFWTKQGLQDVNRGLSLKLKHGYPTVYYTFLNNVHLNNLQNTIIPFPISANEAVEVLKSYNCNADLIYIDASHEECAVYQDITNYWQLLKPGGILFGDDYQSVWPGVIKSVNRFCEENKLRVEVKNKVWFIKK